jgi:hypothetical protein
MPTLLIRVFFPRLEVQFVVSPSAEGERPDTNTESH